MERQQEGEKKKKPRYITRWRKALATLDLWSVLSLSSRPTSGEISVGQMPGASLHVFNIETYKKTETNKQQCLNILGHKEKPEVLFSVFIWKLRAEVGKVRGEKVQFYFLNENITQERSSFKIFIQLFQDDESFDSV